MHVQEGKLIANPNEVTIDFPALAARRARHEAIERPRAPVLLQARKQFLVGNWIGFRRKRRQAVASAREHQCFDLPVAERQSFEKVSKLREGPSVQDLLSAFHGQAFDGGQADPDIGGLDRTACLR